MTRKRALMLAVCAGASPAFAHGIDGVVHALAIAGAAVGIVGGLVTAAQRVKIALGLGTSLGLLIIGGMLFMLAGVRQLADPLAEIGAMLLLLGMFAAVPLIVAFFVLLACSPGCVRHCPGASRAASGPHERSNRLHNTA